MLSPFKKLNLPILKYFKKQLYYFNIPIDYFHKNKIKNLKLHIEIDERN